MRVKNNTVRRITAVMLCLVTAVTFMPLFDASQVFAEEHKEMFMGSDKDAVNRTAEEMAKAESDAQAGVTALDIEEEEEPAEARTEAEDVTEAVVKVEGKSGAAKEKGLSLSNEDDPPQNVYFNVTAGSDGYVDVEGHVGDEGISFDELYVDDDYVESLYDETEFKTSIDMKDYEVGYHTVRATLNGSSYYAYYTKVFTGIFEKPTISLRDFYSGKKYFTYENNGNSYYYDSSCGLHLEYRKKGAKSWKITTSSIGNYSTAKISKLSPGKTYSVRTCYGKKQSYEYPASDGTYVTENYFFVGPRSKTVNLKIAAKRPPVKNIIGKCRKQWCNKVRYNILGAGTWKWGYAGYGYYRTIIGHRTVRYWYTKIKITVKMKKKPGTAGIYIGQHKKKGNKKQYTTNFTLSGKKKGHKVVVSVQSYQSKIYGGYSPAVKKKVKIK